ncbi:ATP-binding cassette domain-containing protein [Kitasatospora cineracea]|uniref:ABC-type multidrug transport system ATPase subunit n=1 Tax=Kitasatospora cineracea TaxID=88074 RepID=A0A8G1UC27_9ACTN|nr:ATP-binding cassette domain-containing protein [Kitasatospora cineracea]ROR38008.1 ABC-type multidrug transport system ATPase subunit [Kitasatospora cineracea]
MPVHVTDCSFGYRRGVRILDGLSLSLDAGCSVLLGPNGAGKSTLLGLVASALRPEAGHIELDGLDTRNKKDLRAYRRKVGWLPQQVRPVPGLRVREQAAYAGWLKGMSRSEAWERSQQAIEKVGLGPLSDRRSAELSGGQLRRLGIAQTLVHDAQLVLMDEPTAGLDPVQRGVFRELIGELKSFSSFVVSTHQTEDLAEIYDSVVLLDRGRVRHQGPIDSFLALAPEDVSSERRAEAAYAGIVTGEV